MHQKAMLFSACFLFTCLCFLLSVLDANAYNATTMDWQLVQPVCQSNPYDPSSAISRYRSAISSHGYSLYSKDCSILWYELTDSIYGGSDHNYGNIDDKDVAFIGTHGATENIFWNIVWHAWLTDGAFTPIGQPACKARSWNMKLGDDGAEYVHLYACNSANFDMIMSWAWPSATDGLHQLHCFHGVSNTKTNHKADDFVDDGFDGSVSYAWIENFTLWDTFAAGTEICALSMIIGNNKYDAAVRKTYEQFDDFHSDPDVNWAKLHFYCNCNPPGPGNMLVCD